MIYLDNAATTLIKPKSVQSEVLRAMAIAASPGRGGHPAAMYASELVYRCREAAAALFNVPEPEMLVFTFNATHALNIAINSLAGRGSRVLVSGYEHNSVTRPLAAIGADIEVAQANLFDAEGMLNSFRTKISGADLVVCTHVSNVFGFILPIYEIAEICRENSVPLIIDASQSAGVLEIDFKRLGADFIAMPGHKALFGPQGTGILICKNTGKVLLSGGSGSESINKYMPEFLPDRHEAGTHNVPGIAGLYAGINYILTRGTTAIKEYEHILINEIADSLSALQDLELFCGNDKTQSGVLSFRSKSLGCEDIAQRLADEGVCVRSGLHCSPYSHRSAGTLETGTVRISVSPFVTLENAKDFCRILQNLLI